MKKGKLIVLLTAVILILIFTAYGMSMWNDGIHGSEPIATDSISTAGDKSIIAFHSNMPSLPGYAADAGKSAIGSDPPAYETRRSLDALEERLLPEESADEEKTAPAGPEDENVLPGDTLQSGNKPHKEAVSDPKVSALYEAGRQLQGVLKDVKSSRGRDLVQMVISLSYEMIENPEGDFQDEFLSIYSLYQALPEDVKNELTAAAWINIDTSNMEYLISVYSGS